jgi:hypothetical protein
VSVIGPSAIPGGTDPPILFAVLVYPSSNVNDQFKIEYAVTNSTGAVNTDDVLKKYDTAHTSGISEPFFPVHVGTKVVTEKHTVTMTVRSLTHSCPPTQTTFHVNP